MTQWFHAVAKQSVRVLAHPWSIVANTLVWGVWTVWTWQTTPDRMVMLLTVVTFLVGLLILYDQDVTERAILLKLDEVVRAIPEARNTYVGLESRTAKELEQLRGEEEAPC